ncbi:clotting factor C isoform X2 [Aedes albopictus]|uniref:Peptidase S1 domain-containing protein n=1 Tax=Aedes albopictus TaxID=7160 RepID=A0ABM1XVI4_AEDAL|nr:limulus clotting factor C-like isoform X1 [Aedes albopictus]
MSFIDRLVLWAFCLMLPGLSQASYQCGIRKHSFVQLVHHGWTVEEGQWPWHVAIFQKQRGSSGDYACGGTLLDEKHVLTAAHCAVNRETEYALPPSKFELHFGQQNLSTITPNVQIRDVSKVHIHPDHSSHRNDIAVLVMRLPVRYTDYVIPICIDQKADINLRNLEGERGWITGWGTTQTGSISDALRTASLPVVSYLQCFNDNEAVFGNLLNENVFCAGDRNGTSPGTGDSGGGMYFSDGDRWVLRGIVSFAKADELKKEVDTSKFVIFVNVQRFLTWIREIIADNTPQSEKAPQRISERECDKFKGLARKRRNNVCDNSRYPHTVNWDHKVTVKEIARRKFKLTHTV